MNTSTQLQKIFQRLAARKGRFFPETFGKCLRPGAEADAIEQAGKRLGLKMLPELQELYSFGNGQNSTVEKGMLMVPQNLPVSFLTLDEATGLALEWRSAAQHVTRGKWWTDAGYNPLWLPIGFNESKQVALCISTKAGRVTRFTTPEGQISHATPAKIHLNEKLEDYLRDLDAYLAGIRQPFSGLGSNIPGPALCL